MKILRISLIAFSVVALLILADALFNDGLFFNTAISSSIFSVKNAENQYMSINLDRTRYLESIVITNAYYLQKGAEEYAYNNAGNYPSSYVDLWIPASLINPFTIYCSPIQDGSYPVEGRVGYCHSNYSSETYTIVGAGKNGRIVITLHSSYTSN